MEWIPVSETTIIFYVSVVRITSAAFPKAP